MHASPKTLRVVSDNIGTGYIPGYTAVAKGCGPRRTHTLSPRPFVARERLYGFGSLGGMLLVTTPLGLRRVLHGGVLV
jgi:hypothetical protein